ncbi:MAG: hypothetical protein Q3M30_05475 [Candidatus Electrothrix sp. Rat3]|nr:hypothetical protein [Candidatus Electrothrix rattekaaiensis]
MSHIYQIFVVILIFYGIYLLFSRLGRLFGTIFITIGISFFILSIYLYVSLGTNPLGTFSTALFFFIGGLLLRKTDSTKPPIKPDINAKICPDCKGKGTMISGYERAFYYECVTKKFKCKSCVNGRYQNRALVGIHDRCDSCNGRGYTTVNETVKKYTSEMVPVIIECKTCEKTGYIGKHVERIQEIKLNNSRKQVAYLILFFCIILVLFYSSR